MPASGRSATAIPHSVPTQKFRPKARRAGNPKSPNGRPSMRAMTKPGKIAASIMLASIIMRHQRPRSGWTKRMNAPSMKTMTPSPGKSASGDRINSVGAEKNLAQWRFSANFWEHRLSELRLSALRWSERRGRGRSERRRVRARLRRRRFTRGRTRILIHRCREHGKTLGLPLLRECCDDSS